MIKLHKRRNICAGLFLTGTLILSALSACGRSGAENTPVFDDILEAQKLTVYTAHKAEVYRPIIQEFEESTGIWVEVRAGGTTELLEDLQDMQNASKHEVDIMFGGGIEMLEAYKDCFQPYQSPLEAKLDPIYLSPDHYWTPFTELPIVFIYNSKIVQPESAPHSWQDFLDGSWKGSISFADPSMSGTSYTILETMKDATQLPEEAILTRFCDDLDGHLAKGSGEVLTEVANGDRLVGITLEESALKEIARGSDVGISYPTEGTSAVPDGAAIVKNAPHPENAERFLDFILSDPVQRYTISPLFRRSVRTDLSTNDKTVGLRILAFDIEEASERQTKVLQDFWQIWEARYA